MTEVYVVLEASWEYNDEFYYRPEGEGGIPIKIFKSKAAAQEYCVSLTRKALEDGDNWEKFTQYGEFKIPKRAAKYLDKTLDGNLDQQKPPPEVDLDVLASLLGDFFYEVHEVDMEGNLK